MSETAAFDTDRFVKPPPRCGVTGKQAEILAGAHAAPFASNPAAGAEIVTLEADIVAVEGTPVAKVATVEAKTANVEGNLVTRLAKVVAEVVKIDAANVGFVKWMIGGMIVQGALIVALIELL